ncbi:MAG: preprotein translocase subunit SecE [Pseudoxanthomonas sp.]
MNSKVENHQGASGADIAKYVVAVALVVAGLAVWFWLPGHAAQLGSWATPLRIGAVVAGLVLGAGVFLATAKGRDTREFLSESRFELRKVVWPTRQEATRMTWVVVVVVAILSLILAGFDLVIKSAIEWFLSSGRGA